MEPSPFGILFERSGSEKASRTPLTTAPDRKWL
jgi:hypothetical protein